MFLATLDSRTSLGCRNFSQTRWKYDDPKAPQIPRHYNCRSIKLLVVEGIDPLVGTRASKGAGSEEGKFQGAQVDAKTTQNEWLKRQPNWFLDEALGAEWRRKMFREGVDVKKFFNRAEQRPYTLDELKRSDSKIIKEAIAEAGL